MTKQPDAYEIAKCIEDLVCAHLLLWEKLSQHNKELVSEAREQLYQELNLLCIGRK